jgi:hypothetical protein
VPLDDASGRNIRGALVACLAVLGALAFSPSGAAATRAPGCPPASAHVLARGRSLRVYSLGSRTPASTRIEACVTGRGRRMTLLAPAKGSGLRRSLGGFAFAGTKLAYVEDQFGVDSGSLNIVVVDVAHRRVLRVLRGVGGYVDAGILGSSQIGQVVLGASGSVAWITEAHGPRANPTLAVAVHAASLTGAISTLDEGPDIEFGSLTLSGTQLGWRHGGAERHAPLP